MNNKKWYVIDMTKSRGTDVYLIVSIVNPNI